MNRRKYTMDMTTANNILQNVFIAGDMEPNTIPFDKIVLRSKAKTTLVTACMWIGVVMLLLTLLSPLAFTSQQELKITQDETDESVRIVSHQLYTSEFVMMIEGNKLDYRNVYAAKSDGSIIYPSRIRFVNDNTEITIPYDGAELNIYIPDTDGNVIQAILSER